MAEPEIIPFCYVMSVVIEGEGSIDLSNVPGIIFTVSWGNNRALALIETASETGRIAQMIQTQANNQNIIVGIGIAMGDDIFIEKDKQGQILLPSRLNRSIFKQQADRLAQLACLKAIQENSACICSEPSTANNIEQFIGSGYFTGLLDALPHVWYRV